MPAVDTWLGTVSTSFDTAANWSLGTVPQAGDDIVFTAGTGSGIPPTPTPIGDSTGGTGDGGSGSGGTGSTSIDCYGMHAATGGAYNSVTLDSTYTGTVTVVGGFSTVGLVVANGNIAQPTSGTDITATLYLTWTGGTINSTSNVANLILDGAAGSITPNLAGTVITGDNFSLLNTASLNVNPGTLQFNDGTGIDLGENTSMFVNANAPAGQQAKVNFSGDGKPWSETDKQITLNAGATVTVTGPGSWNQGHSFIHIAGCR